MNFKVSKKAFTLIELIVVIAVLAVLAVLIIPQVTGYIQASQKSTCDANVAMMNRSYIYEHELDSKITPQNIIENTNGRYFGGNTKKCPANGTYSVDSNNKIICSIHGKSSSGDSEFITNGTIEDERKNAIDNPTNNTPGTVVKSTDKDGNTLYFKCINTNGCGAAPTQHLGEGGYSNTGWKELIKDYTDYNNYETGDVIVYNNRYYQYIATNETPGNQKYIGKTPNQVGSGFQEVPAPSSK